MEKSKKIVLLGQFGVGKTSLVRRFMMDTFGKDYQPTLGVQISKKEILLPSGKVISMIIWDLEGFSKMENTRSSYLLGSKGFIYVFDCTRSITYERIAEEISYIKQEYPLTDLLIIGNKKDATNTKKVAQDILKKGVDVHSFVSAKTGEGVVAVFNDLGRIITS